MSALAGISAAFALLQSSAVLQKAEEAAVIARNSADAHGGEERLGNAEGIIFGFSGEAYFPYQGPTPGLAGAFQYLETTQFDYAAGVMTVTSGFAGGETAFERTATYDAAKAGIQGTIARQLRQSPHALLRAWIAAPRMLTLSARNKSHWVVSGVFYGTLVSAHINRKSLLVDRIEVPFDDVRHGDASAIIEFSDYDDSGGWKIPGRIRVVEAGSVILDLPYAPYELLSSAPSQKSRSDEPADDADALPPQAAQSLSEVERPSDETFLFTDYGDGVRVLFNSGGPDYHSLAVATDDGVMVVETPGAIADGAALAERAAALGEVRYLASTHHHGDHSAGMPGAAAPDRQVVAAQSHVDFFKEMITAPRHFLQREFNPVADPAFIAVPAGGMQNIGGKVLAYDAGPTGHSDAHLVFYAPQAKLLFQTDMAVFRWDGSVEAARTQTCRLREFISEKALDVDIIVGGHGRPGTLADLDAAIAQRSEGCA